MKEKISVIEIVNERIIEQLKKGVNPWNKPWVTSRGVNLNTPRNYITDKDYTGINISLLPNGYFLTYKQILSLGGKLRKGAKGYLVVFSKVFTPKQSEIDHSDKNSKSKFMLRYYRVFDLEDTEGCKEITNRVKREPVKYQGEAEIIGYIEESLERYLESSNVKYSEVTQGRAYYNPILDEIVVPSREQFKDTGSYYSVKFHEIAHSTGHKSRLNREGITNTDKFGSDIYSKEELIAEISSSYLLSHFGIDSEEVFKNNVAYLAGWARKLESNINSWIILRASTEASKAYKLILGLND